jgi:hypothetical protein
MKLIDVNTKNGVINLFADYVLKAIGQDSNTIISVVNLNQYLICVNGVTTNPKIELSLQELKNFFIAEYPTICERSEFDKIIGVLDLIQYNMSEVHVPDYWHKFYKTSRPIYSDNNKPSYDYENTLQITSNFPFGYGFKAGRDLFYYSEYIAYNILAPTFSDDITIKLTKSKIDEFDQELYLNTNSTLFATEKIKSLVLDIFDFDFAKFSTTLSNYNILQDSLNPLSSKPWLIKDKHPNDLIIF